MPSEICQKVLSLDLRRTLKMCEHRWTEILKFWFLGKKWTIIDCNIFLKIKLYPLARHSWNFHFKQFDRALSTETHLPCNVAQGAIYHESPTVKYILSHCYVEWCIFELDYCACIPWAIEENEKVDSVERLRWEMI